MAQAPEPSAQAAAAAGEPSAAAHAADPAQPPRWAFPVIFATCLLVATPLILSTWRRSGDPVVDFGRDLYGAWRILGGAVPLGLGRHDAPWGLGYPPPSGRTIRD